MKLKNLLFSLLIFCLISYLFIPTMSFSEEFYKRPIRVSGDNNYPPYEFIDDNDNFRGFNVDIIRAIAIELGIEIDLVSNSWEDTMDLLKKGEIDAVQGMTITPEREKTYDFTDEIVMNSQSIFVLRSTENISSLDDLIGKKIAIQSEDVTSEIVSAVQGIDVTEKINQKDALQSLITGEVDAYVGNRLTGIYYVQSFGLTNTVKIVGEQLYPTKYCIAVQRGNDELLHLLNSGLRAIKENGTYDKIFEKWFGETIPDINLRWRKLLYVSLIALSISIVSIFIIYYWNKTLKKEVEIQTKEVIKLNNMIMHNDKMQALGKLSAGIAHELRNPLTSIKAFVDLLPLKYEDKSFRDELIKIVPREISRLNDLVETMLDYSKPKNPNPRKISLNELLSDILTLLKQKLNEKKIVVSLRNVDVFFYADESQMKQILINIILNSIDAIESTGQIWIEGNVYFSSVSISIKDDGIGIPDEEKDKLFDPFYSSKKNSYGIGLSVTDRLVRDNRGEIQVFSQLNQGTTVLINMPIGPELGEDGNDA
ncbi:MAG: transporter substrate-binding domain-containing protein [Tissierellaceae bacterium]|nr:transporter substrate-binding domain-containing protein [Tissierellaceae bacterium]